MTIFAYITGLLLGLGISHYLLPRRENTALCPRCKQEMIWITSNEDQCPNCALLRIW